jgi:hypothetical protein
MTVALAVMTIGPWYSVRAVPSGTPVLDEFGNPLVGDPGSEGVADGDGVAEVDGLSEDDGVADGDSLGVGEEVLVGCSEGLAVTVTVGPGTVTVAPGGFGSVQTTVML